MKSKMGLVILIILVIVVAAFAAIVVAGGVSLGGGNKVTVLGTVSYNMITRWSVTYDDCHIEEDGFLALLWYFPWQTKDIQIVVELSGGGKKYEGDGWAGKLNVLAGDAGYSVDIHHVPDGSYNGKIYLYEVEKGIIGEKNRVLQATNTFRVNV